MKLSYALDASTALNWAVPEDRVMIAENLRANGEVLAAEIVNAKNPADRFGLFRDVSWVYRRLAVCDMDAARQTERRIEMEMRRDTVCRITLERMADMMWDANVAGNPVYERNYLEMGQAFAKVIRDEGLNEWFSTGPYSGLGRLAHTIAEMDIDRALQEREALPELCKMARMIPLDQGVDEEKIESQVFRDGVRLFRRHQGLEKYGFEM